jgi:4-aminobutyrate aminotransferase/(S)-3-amino-2-methylpropionate transaminase
MFDRFLINNMSAELPTSDFPDLLRANVMPIAPSGMRSVHLTDGSCTQANESALSIAMVKYAKDHKVADLADLCVLGFEHAYHGTSIGTLSCSDERTNIQGAPLLNWPTAPFPKMKYPMA